jgi:hypothetical protein
MNPLKPFTLPNILALFLAVMLTTTALVPEHIVQADTVLPPPPQMAAVQSDEGPGLAAADKPYKSYLPYATRPGLNVTRFATLPPGSKLPSEADCAAAVKDKPENKRMNKTYNATKGSQSVGSIFASGAGTNIYNSRITGNFTGTTDEILQWTACKWGIDEDIVRAQAAKESWWQMTAKGDWTSDASRCAPGHELGVDGTDGLCPESFGMLQNRYPYEQDSWPGIYNSTAFNADVAYGYWRACYEGYTTWLGSGYAKGDQWGCVGRWFAGAWHTSAAEGYITVVKDYYNQRIWETPGFQEP